MHGLLEDIGISVIAATFVGVLTHRIKQPIILGYLLTGALIGPEIGLKFVTNPVNIEIISEIGLLLLLFIIGFEMNPQKIIASGRQILLAGMGQFIFCVFLGSIVFSLLGYGLSGEDISGLYLSLLCAISSTAIVVKLLYDKLEIDTLPGRITIGILIIQDIWAILILAFQPNFLTPKFILLGLAILKGLLLLGGGFLLSKYVLRYVFEWVSESPEMVVVVSIGWCALISGAAGVVGLSKEMGALIAGISISTFPYSIHVTTKVLPLRDFFLTLFFISLGMKIIPPKLDMIFISLVIVIFTIFSRFLTIYPILSFSGAGRRTCFISSLNLSQISEFSLIIASLGLSYGHIQQDIMTTIIYSMAITSIISSYLIKFNHEIYQRFDRLMNSLGFKAREIKEKEEEKKDRSYPILILGFHRGARSLIEVISQRKPDLLQKILVIDFSLEVLRELKVMNIATLFGDISSVDTLKQAHIEDAKVILSTVPDMLLKGTTNFDLVKNCRLLSPHATIVATADTTSQIEELKKVGANEVLLPYTMVGEYLASFLENILKN